MAQDEEHSTPSSPVRADQRSLIPYQVVSDEIDLVDLGASLWRRRWVFFASFALVFGLGIAYAFIHQPSFEYRALMRVGSLHGLASGHSGAVVSPEQVASSIKQVYVPLVEGQLIHSGVRSIEGLKIEANVPKGTETVSLSVEAPSRDGPTARKLLTRVVAMAQSGINRKLDEYRTREASYLKQQIRRLGRKVDSLEAQARSLNRESRGVAAASYVAVSVARLMGQEANFRHQLDVSMPLNIESSGMVGGVVRTLRPATMGRATILVAAAVIALFLAFISSALVGYACRVRDRLKTQRGRAMN